MTQTEYYAGDDAIPYKIELKNDYGETIAKGAVYSYRNIRGDYWGHRVMKANHKPTKSFSTRIKQLFKLC